MEAFAFDKIIDRKGTNCNKWDGRRSGVPVREGRLPFTIADMDFASPPCVVEAIQKRAQHPIFGYSHPTDGLTEAMIGWMERRHGVSIEKDWIKTSTGILTGISFALRAVTRPGDRVMVFTPVYNPFFTIIESAGCELVECELAKTEGRYSIDYQAVEEQFRGGIKAILFCNPHNPVGRVWTRDELEKLADLCVKHHVYFLADEAHADIELFGYRYTPLCALEQLKELGISCVSPNKSFNLPGAGMAFLMIPNAAIAAATAAGQRGVWITSPPIMSMVAAEAAYNGADEWMDAVNGYIGENSLMVRGFIEEHMPKIAITPHEGTYLMWLDVSCFGMSSGDVGKELAEKYGVQLSSGQPYRGDGDLYLRFNIAAPRELVRRGLEAMVPMYQKYCADD